MYCTDSDDAAAVPADLRYLISPFPEVRRRYGRYGGARRGLGVASTGTEVSEGVTAITAGTAAVSAIAAGAAIGSVVPVLGTAIGAIVGLGISLLGGNKEAGGVNNPTYLAIAQKWYYWYFPQWWTMNAAAIANGSLTLASGLTWWAGQMQANGIANAWQNFSTSAQPVAAGVKATALVYQNLGYGAPTDVPPAGTNPQVAPPQNVPYTQYVQTAPGATLTPAQVAAGVVAGTTVAPPVATLVPGVSNTTLAFGALGLLAVIALSRRRGRSAPRSET